MSSEVNEHSSGGKGVESKHVMLLTKKRRHYRDAVDSPWHWILWHFLYLVCIALLLA
jgi:hypothetical protein